MWAPEYTKQFKKDFKRCDKRGLPLGDLETVMKMPIAGKALAEKHRDHTLKGDYEGFGECHIKPDWLLINLRVPEERIIRFVRTGSHSDLFD
ncbi:MAG: type II toxin-antitoxin system YafQ family toxin [Fibrobacteres bacterium]|jgi:mRNA interferase YafQ|nr:type II toxin-antitoxin system YafQ family toxin [Fibrobacterota bacterium]